MSEQRYLDSDIVPLRGVTPVGGKHPLVATLFWGDRVRVVGRSAEGHVVELPRRTWNADKQRYDHALVQCRLPRGVRFRDEPILKVRFVDVGQGDGAMVESPKGQIVLVDGGEGEHIRHYVSAAFAHLLRTRPLPCGAIVVTHGDADHYAGLTRLLEWRSKGANPQPLVTADRVFHNGLVKRTAGGSDPFGRTVKRDGVKYAVALEDDLRQVDDRHMNQPFQKWKKALGGLRTRDGKKPSMRRLQYGDHDAFDFLRDEGVDVKVLGPIADQVNNAPALPFLGDASHTINGHSVVLKLTYGNVRFLFGADLNEPSQERLLQRAGQDSLSLTAEILKVPHHGSADFSPRMLEAVRPVVSVVSSGDESAAKEYIHPRAGLVGALGRFSRGTVDKPLIYVSEMVAFFRRLSRKDTPIHNAYQKTAFGIVHVRTDGHRVLVVTHSGKDDKKEAYAFGVDDRGEIAFEPDVRPAR
jgi:beta-lactamase superfamily II metal-dependent hydrolase